MQLKCWHLCVQWTLHPKPADWYAYGRSAHPNFVSISFPRSELLHIRLTRCRYCSHPPLKFLRVTRIARSSWSVGCQSTTIHNSEELHNASEVDSNPFLRIRTKTCKEFVISWLSTNNRQSQRRCRMPSEGLTIPFSLSVVDAWPTDHNA